MCSHVEVQLMNKITDMQTDRPTQQTKEGTTDGIRTCGLWDFFQHIIREGATVSVCTAVVSTVSPETSLDPIRSQISRWTWRTEREPSLTCLTRGSSCLLQLRLGSLTISRNTYHRTQTHACSLHFTACVCIL